MVKIIFLITCLIAAFIKSSTSTDIKCSYSTGGDYTLMGNIYRCIVSENLNILTEESAQISNISGTHKNFKSNNDVIGFHAFSKTIQFFPKGLEKFFKNIKLFSIYNCKLKEIHQSDLKVFFDLVFLFLSGNEIEVIEAGLFDFNPKLEFLGFWESKIIHIDPNVFDNLVNLSYFWFTNVPCFGQEIDNSKEEVQQAIKVVKSNCTNLEFSSLEGQVEILENESKTLNFAAFNTKLEVLESNLNASKFSKFRPLNYKFQNLKSIASSIHLIRIITDKFEDLESSQCGLKRPIDDLRSSQNAIQTSLSDIKSIVTSYGSNSGQLQVCQSNLTSSQLIMAKSIDKMSSEVNKQSVSLDNLNIKVSEVQDMQKYQKAVQAAHGSTLNNLKESHDQMSKTLTNLEAKLTDVLKTSMETKILDLKADIKSDMSNFIVDILTKTNAKNDQNIKEVKKHVEQIHEQLFKSVGNKLNAIEGSLMAQLKQIIKDLRFDE